MTVDRANEQNKADTPFPRKQSIQPGGGRKKESAFTSDSSIQPIQRSLVKIQEFPFSKHSEAPSHHSQAIVQTPTFNDLETCSLKVPAYYKIVGHQPYKLPAINGFTQEYEPLLLSNKANYFPPAQLPLANSGSVSSGVSKPNEESKQATPALSIKKFLETDNLTYANASDVRRSSSWGGGVLAAASDEKLTNNCCFNRIDT